MLCDSKTVDSPLKMNVKLLPTDVNLISKFMHALCSTHYATVILWIDCRLLSPRTTYAAYLVFKLASKSYGLGPPRQLASVKLGDYALETDICLQDDDDSDDDDDDDDDDQEEGRRRQQQRQQRLRNDGWMEIELGEFYNDEGDDGDVEMRLSEVNAGHWKSGLIIQGLEVRPQI
ncbi:putative F-box protein PP2-B8 [Phoenix dactylifera]|uniref:F-box protein PP2-B8 n=1 Tax=Phoenix dactylifera TaxID=42345 RepID=A0A8B8ZFI5_PHODC|nr:putative F-box protein PP2-B8 [Phoenix dactylifera]